MKKFLIIKLNSIKRSILKKVSKLFFKDGYLFKETTIYLFGFKVKEVRTVSNAVLTIF